MSELALAALFQAIVQIESGGNLKARNGDAYGPAQIKPVVVEDLKRAGYDVSLRERGTMDGSFRLFKLYTQHWIQRRKLKDTPRTRANIWRYGPFNSKTTHNDATYYSKQAEFLMSRKK
jgi:hypothetical protein